MLDILPYLLLGLILLLPINFGILLSFILQNIGYEESGTDVGSFGFLLVLLKIAHKNDIKIKYLINKFRTLKLVLFILAIQIFWSLNFAENAQEFIISSFRILICIITIAYYFESGGSVRLWEKALLISLFIVTLNNTLLANEIHPYIETVKEWGRLSGRGITGQMINSNVVSYTLLLLFCFILVIKLEKDQKLTLFGKFLISTLVIILLINVGQLSSRAVILSLILVFPIVFFKLKYVFYFALVFYLLNLSVDFGSVEIPLIGDAANERLHAIQTEEVSESSEASRAIILISGLRLFFDNFLFGVGTGNIAESMADPNYLGMHLMIHNAYLDYAVQFGLMGVLMVVMFLKFGYNLLIQNTNLAYIFLVCVLVPNFGHDFMQMSLTWVFILFLEIALIQRGIILPVKNKLLSRKQIQII